MSHKIIEKEICWDDFIESLHQKSKYSEEERKYDL